MILGSADDLAAEQAVIDHAQACLGAMMARTADTVGIAERVVRDENTVDARIAHWHLRRRQAELAMGSGPLSFGRIDTEPVGTRAPAERWYVGRRHVEDASGNPVVVDWRAPVSAPFYRATSIDPCGLTARRRFGFDGSTLVSIFDEDLTDPDADHHGGLPDPLLAELERSRSGQMRDIVATIAAEQDRIIRADLGELLVVQGGPGTGKTAVGLHRAAFLLFQHRHQLDERKILVVGPNPVFLGYIADVLPSLGETAVVQATVAGLMAARYRVRAVDDVATTIVKGDRRMVEVIERFLEAKIVIPPDGLEIRSGVAVVRFSADDVERFRSTALGRRLPLNTAREVFRQLIVQEAWRRHSARPGVDPGGQPAFAAAIGRDPEFKADIDRLWPRLSPPMVVRELYGSRRKLASAASGVLADDEWPRILRSGAKKRSDEPWTEADLAVLDEVVARVQGVPATYGHVIVDEAQDHSAMSLRLLSRRAERGSMTILGDLAQATSPVAVGDWDQALALLTEPHLHRGQGRGGQGSQHGVSARVVELTIGYRVPASILDLANRLLAVAAPGITPTRSIRPGGTMPLIVSTESERLDDTVVAEVQALRDQTESLAVVSVDSDIDRLRQALNDAGVEAETVGGRRLPGAAAVAVIGPDQVKGLEFDAIVVVEPAAIAETPRGLLRLYVALTRAVHHLGIVHARPLPEALRG